MKNGIEKRKDGKKKEVKKTETSNRFIFIKQKRSDKISKTDLILKLNTKIRRIEGVPQTIKTIKISYSRKRSISILLSDKSNANELLNGYKDKLIKTVKAVDILIIKIKIVIK